MERSKSVKTYCTGCENAHMEQWARGRIAIRCFADAPLMNGRVIKIYTEKEREPRVEAPQICPKKKK